MATLADAYVRLRPDTSRVGPELREQTAGPAGAAGDEAGSHFGKRMALAIGAAVAAGAVLITRRLVGELRQSIDSASDLSETVSKVGVVFGAGAGAVMRFASTADVALGQSKRQALDGAATFALYGKQAGLTGAALVPFSTNLVELASDMASFSNTSPEEAIQAIGSAMRGENDPIERYNVLLNDSTLKARALKLGLIETTKEALTPQQRVLAVQAELLAQTSDAQGDFGRTSMGLANQQRIAASQVENLRTRIGTALMPAMTAWYTMVNLKLIPVLNDLWTKHGPAVTKFVEQAAVKFGAFVEKLGTVDWGGIFGQLRDILADLRADAGPALSELADRVGPFGEALKNDLLPALRDLREQGGEGLGDTLRVTGTVMSFLADHVDTLAKALPYLAAALVAAKVVQLGANAAMAASPFIRLAEIAATNRQTAAVKANTAAVATSRSALTAATAAQVGETAATNSGLLARIRSAASTAAHAVVTGTTAVGAWVANTAAMVANRVAMVAHTVASGAARAAAVAWTAAQWLLNAALLANPIGLVLVALAALVGGMIWAYHNVEVFRTFWDHNWALVMATIKAVVGWITGTAVPFLGNAWNTVANGVNNLRDRVVGAFVAVVAFVRGVPGQILGAIGNLGSLLIDQGVNLVHGLWNGIQRMGGWLRDKLIGWAKAAIPGPIAKALGIASPSKVAAEMIGRPFGEGIAAGIESTTGQITAAVTRSLPLGSFRPRVPQLPAAAGRSQSSAGGDWRKLVEVLERVVDAVERVAPGVGRELNGAASGMVQMARAR